MEGMQEAVSSSNCLKIVKICLGLTFDAELQSPGVCVALDVGGGAGVEAGGGPGHPLQHQRGGAQQDAGLQVLDHPRALQHEDMRTWRMNYSGETKISCRGELTFN